MFDEKLQPINTKHMIKNELKEILNELIKSRQN